MRLIYGSVVLAAILISFSTGYEMRAQAERSQWKPPPAHPWPIISLVRTADGLVLADAAPAKKPTYKPNLKPYEVLDEVRRAIKENFVRTQVDETELTYGAVRGMLRSLGDRFTRFLTPEEYDEFKVKNDGEFTGIGARIDLKEDYTGSSAAKPYGASRPYIVEPIEGGPAQKAGLQRDDVILSINGHSTADLSENSVVQFIRGVRGTAVKIKIERKAKAPEGAGRDANFKVLDITLMRDVIEMHPVKLEWLPERIAWLRLDEFNKKSEAEMVTALRELQKGVNGQGAARGLILDMRDNPGGLLDVAVDIGSHFISAGPIVYTRERDGSERPLNAERDRFLDLKIPIVVLVNKYSASAAEIVAGAMKDKNVATIMGEQSYGKASVQVLIELKNGGALVITTAKYLTPGKHDISDKGISPDFPIKADDKDEKSGRGAQLDAAVDFIKKKVTGSTVAKRPAQS